MATNKSYRISIPVTIQATAELSLTTDDLKDNHDMKAKDINDESIAALLAESMQLVEYVGNTIGFELRPSQPDIECSFPDMTIHDDQITIEEE